MSVLALTVLERAAAARAETGNENLGFLSEECGLLPITPPSRALPPSHRIWDETATHLPALFRSVTGREALAQMPRLDAGQSALPDAHLLRAASLLGHFAHSFVRVRPDPPDRLPECITAPWDVVCRRLGRDHTALTYDDLVNYNWRMVDESDPRRWIENLAVLTPTVANREEWVFYMAQVEIHARMAPSIGAMARAQQAGVDRDEATLALELANLVDMLEDATSAFLKIDANPHSPTHVDPVVWAKTVAPFAVAIQEGQHAISGAAAPIFQVFDVFIARRAYESRVGRLARGLRPGFPPNLRDFMTALEAAPGSDCALAGSPRLRSLWSSLLEVYGGDRGFLGVHRRKAYAYLELAFKVGRSVTTGGFSGLFEDQTWEVANDELEASRLERWVEADVALSPAHADGSGPLQDEGLAHLRLDLGVGGLRFKPGDRLAIRPRNSTEITERTIRALQATGDELIRLDGRWRVTTGADRLALRELIERGSVRPVARPVAKALLAFSESERLRRIVNERAEHAWELWDLLELLGLDGFDARALWKADPWEPYSLPQIVPPLVPRLYSVASAMDGNLTGNSVEVVAGELHYAHPETPVTPGRQRTGTASSYLRRLAATGDHAAVEVRVVPASRFRLPDDPGCPIVMLAGGTGISPFRAFIQARATQPSAGPTWLLLSTRSERQRDLLAREAGWIRFDAVVTGGRDGSSPRLQITDLIAGNATALTEFAAAGAVFYICGSAGFARTVIQALELLTSRDAIRTMIASGQLQQDVFTSGQPPAAAATPFDATDVAQRNDEDAGYWTIIDGAVYDVTEFVHRHPGGAAILREVAGRDGSVPYRQIEHHLDSEIEAMLPMYRVGTVRRLDFGRRGALAVGDTGLTYVLLDDLFRAWVRYLHLVVEVQNAVRHDFGILDAAAISGDNGQIMTFLKAQLLLEAHIRFTDVYLPALLDRDLHRLFAFSAAFVAPEVDVRDLPRALDAQAHGAAARAAAGHVAAIVTRLGGLGDADPHTRDVALAEMASLRQPLENADLALLATLKTHAATGVRSLERFERTTPERAGVTLLSPLRAIPGLVSELYDAVAAALAGHGTAVGRA
jgi:cytochrome b involved in lipid metabolism